MWDYFFDFDENMCMIHKYICWLFLWELFVIKVLFKKICLCESTNNIVFFL